jgi:hypothetical protein
VSRAAPKIRGGVLYRAVSGLSRGTTTEPVASHLEGEPPRSAPSFPPVHRQPLGLVDGEHVAVQSTFTKLPLRAKSATVLGLRA